MNRPESDVEREEEMSRVTRSMLVISAIVIATVRPGSTQTQDPKIITRLPQIQAPEQQRRRPVISGPLAAILQNQSIVAAAVWHVAFLKHEPSKSDSAAEADFIAALPMFTGSSAAFVALHADALRKVIKYPGQTFAGDKGESPIIILRDTEGGDVLQLGPIASDTVYNILRSTARQRAAKVASSILLPALRRLAEAVATEPQIGVPPRVAVAVIYGTRNSADSDSLMDLKPEAITVIVPLSTAVGFSKSSITEDDLLEKADVFVMDRDTPDLKKIRLQLQ
jgi:hypothetical protein